MFGLILRGGDFALPSLEVDPSIGDLARTNDENGDEGEANASNPVRLVAVGVEEEEPNAEPRSDTGGDCAGVLENDGGGDGAALLEKMF